MDIVKKKIVGNEFTLKCECGGEYCYTGVNLPIDSMNYENKCSRCGNTIYIDEAYPYILYTDDDNEIKS